MVLVDEMLDALRHHLGLLHPLFRVVAEQGTQVDEHHESASNCQC